MPYKSFGSKTIAAPPPTPRKRDKPKRVRKIASTKVHGRVKVFDTSQPAIIGRMTDAEKSIITGIVAQTPGDVTDAQTQALAIAMRRTPDAIANAVRDARAKLAANIGRYVDLHIAAAESAIADDPDVTRKAAEWAMANISAKRADGSIERLVDAKDVGDRGPAISIGIALGGIPNASPPISLADPAIAADVITMDANEPTPSRDIP